ncbi:MAG: GNAT family N-acetyltransferase [Bacteroidetes bacterium]|nr:GNAT family N-acetyltransferase [Bacteroidota bacterium]
MTNFTRTPAPMQTGEELQIVKSTENEVAQMYALGKKASDEGVIDPVTNDELKEMVSDEGHYVICAKEGDKVVGFATNQYAWGKIHILDIVVDENKRRSGIGKKIVEHLIAHSKEKKLIETYCEVKAKNTASLKLFKSLKFKERLFCEFVNGGFYGLFFETKPV